MGLCDINGKPITTPSNGGVTLAQHVIDNPNLADPSAFSAGLLTGTGVFDTGNPEGATTDYIPCSPGQIVTVGGINGHNHNPWFIATDIVYACYGYYFYDSSKAAVSGATSRPDVSNGITVPEDASYIRVSFYGDAGAGNFFYSSGCKSGFVHVGDSFCTEPKWWFKNNIEREWIPAESVGYTYQPPYAGKRWVLFGDSLTDGYGGHGWDESTSPVGGIGWKDTEERVPWTGYFWASRIAREFGMTIENRAHGGTNINYGTKDDKGNNGCLEVDNFIAELEAGTTEEPAYITVGFGSNSVLRELGTIDDTSDTTTTTCGAVKYIIEKLRAACPNAVIGFVLPPKSTWNADGDMYNETDALNVYKGREAIKSVLDSDDYLIPYVDMWTESGITLDMLPDNIHVSSIESNNLYYHAMRRFMMGL